MTILTTDTLPDIQVELLFERAAALSQGSDEIDPIHVLVALAEGRASERFAYLLQQHGLRYGALLSFAHIMFEPGSCINPSKTAAYAAMDRKAAQFDIDFGDESSLTLEGWAEFALDSGSEWIAAALRTLEVSMEDLREDIHRYATH